MNKYTKNELEESIRSLQSTLNKCEKVIEKLPNHTITIRRIKALKIALELMNKELKGLIS